AAISGAALIFLGVLHFRFSSEPALPRRPGAPKITQVSLQKLDFDANVYRASLEKDSNDYGVPVTTPEGLSGLFPYDVAEPKTTLLPGGAPVETRDLRLSTRVERVTAEYTNGSVESDHLVLRIENKTAQPVAYRVDTTPKLGLASCLQKGDLRH